MIATNPNQPTAASGSRAPRSAPAAHSELTHASENTSGNQ